MVKTAGLYLIPIKSYSKNNYPSFNLKWTLVFVQYFINRMFRKIELNKSEFDFFFSSPHDGKTDIVDINILQTL